MKLFNSKSIDNRKIYAVTSGIYVGQFFVFISETPINETYQILSLPDCITMEIKEKDIKEGLNKNILEPIEKLPQEIYDICIAEYAHRRQLSEKTNNIKNDDNDNKP